MQTQSACLTSFVVLSEAVTSLAWPVIFEFQRTKVVGNGLRNLRISHPRTRFSKCISVEWNHLLRDIWCWREKKHISPFRTMTLFLSEGMLYSSFAFHCIFWAHILFDSCHFVIYMSVTITLELLGLLNFALRLSLQFTSLFSCPSYDFVVFWYS